MMQKLITLIRTRGYVCRGCGTVITTPNSFKKCPVCGIKYD